MEDNKETYAVHAISTAGAPSQANDGYPTGRTNLQRGLKHRHTTHLPKMGDGQRAPMDDLAPSCKNPKTSTAQSPPPKMSLKRSRNVSEGVAPSSHVRVRSLPTGKRPRLWTDRWSPPVFEDVGRE